ncbi:hypothetical protein [Photobacterium atrarenae]|uniref:Uncharacterized protein n=1 Tax=Photobacterium atrarenae TaxID=865757 RepID=A0ABY5GN93_9GAMM|nr:hypothetical protein [Photobacterium atrarenae]UTV30803.1 hypothetical protein NNL38_19795 [Photobacterium atrarenae]
MNNKYQKQTRHHTVQAALSMVSMQKWFKQGGNILAIGLLLIIELCVVSSLSTQLITEVLSRINAPYTANQQSDDQWSMLLSHLQEPQ